MKKLMKLIRDAKNEIIAALVVSAIGWVLSTLLKASVAVIAISVFSLVWFLCLLLYFRKRRVRPSEWRKKEKTKQANGPFYYSDAARRFALIGSIVIPILAIGVTSYIRYQQALPADDFIVLVADFDGPDSEKYRVTETILNRLRQSLVKYDHVVVESLGRSISEQEGSGVARTEANLKKASIVIWGWYGVTQQSVPMSINFEILCPLKCAPDLSSELQGDVQIHPVSQLESFGLQSQLSEDMALMSLLTVGLVEYSDDNWNAAVANFTDALSQSENSPSARDVYYFRAMSYMWLKRNDLALSDFSQVIKIDPNYALAFHNRAILLGLDGRVDESLLDLSQAIKLEPENAAHYNARAVLFIGYQNYQNALEDLDRAITLDPEEPEYLFNQGLTYYWLNDFDSALPSLDRSIELFEKMLRHESDPDLRLSGCRAYIYRAAILLDQGKNQAALNDYNRAIELQPDYANAYHGRAAVYSKLHLKERVIEDLQKAISLSTDPARRQQMEQQLQDVLSH